LFPAFASPHGWLMKGGGWVGNLLSPALSSTRVWRRGRRRAVLPFMSQPCIEK
jgi:hypothetical protein